jgi:hypothetical protein
MTGLAAMVTPKTQASPEIDNSCFARAAESAHIAGYSISKVQRWLHEKALPMIDPETGLYRADGQWNYHNTAADCYPFLCWAAHLTDRDALMGPIRNVLAAEQALCNHVDRIPVSYDWKTKQKVTATSYDQLVFGASEYVKDGLIAIVEATGKGPWYERMKGIQEDIWKHARVDTPHGKIPSTNVEVNGEQLQALVRLFAMSGDERFLAWAERLADYYLLDEAFLPQRLRDHGCEITGGLGLLVGLESEISPAKAETYLPHLKRIFDTILQRGTNADGLMYNALGNPNSGLSDGWGYNYVGFLCYDMAQGTPCYRDDVERVLGNMLKPAYKNYNWEGRHSIDGYADSIEGAIYLLNRVPVPEGFAWVDRETARNVARSHDPLDTAPLWGTMKLEANGVRTVVMHALMHTRGLIARPWRQDLTLGAAPTGKGGLAVVMTAEKPWQGRLEFDIPRHQHFLGFQHDWPRMNTLPEWYTVDLDTSYRIQREGTPAQTRTGLELRAGFEIQLDAVDPLNLRVEVNET